MALHPKFPKSPYAILDPELRWFPADEALREKDYGKLLPPLVAKLDDFLRVGEHDILTHAGKISHEVAVAKAETEFENYRQKTLNEPSEVKKDFEKAVKNIERKRLKSPGHSRGH